MKIEKIMELRISKEAPYNHKDYTIWLHNLIIESIKYDLWKFREEKSATIKSSYAACSQIMNFESLKAI